jgi:hypothetical protein
LTPQTRGRERKGLVTKEGPKKKKEKKKKKKKREKDSYLRGVDGD